jgi:hypothetical protein
VHFWRRWLRWRDGTPTDGNDDGLHRDVWERVNYGGDEVLEEKEQGKGSLVSTEGKGKWWWLELLPAARNGGEKGGGGTLGDESISNLSSIFHSLYL